MGLTHGEFCLEMLTCGSLSLLFSFPSSLGRTCSDLRTCPDLGGLGRTCPANNPHAALFGIPYVWLSHRQFCLEMLTWGSPFLRPSLPSLLPFFSSPHELARLFRRTYADLGELGRTCPANNPHEPAQLNVRSVPCKSIPSSPQTRPNSTWP